MTACVICASTNIQADIDLGPQPVCNRFLETRDATEYRHALSFGQCRQCGTVGLLDPMPVQEIQPIHDWITYNEPEDHLDGLVAKLVGLEGISETARICGVTFKDDSTLARFSRRGFRNTWRIDPATALGVRRTGVGVETVQDRLTGQKARALVARHGESDLVIVRHILEHAYDIMGFMRAITTLLKPTGYAVFEVPDCTQAFETREYTTFWEEHIVYFTPHTFVQALAFGGFRTIDFTCHRYPFENSLVAMARRAREAQSPPVDQPAIRGERARFEGFVADFAGVADRTRRALVGLRQNGGRILMFGAGHLAATYINVFGLADLIEAVVDDNPHKRGLFMPGSRLPIKDSSALLEDGVRLCLLSLSPQSEDKVIARNRAFVERGGQFASIFRTSPRALKLGEEHCGEA